MLWGIILGELALLGLFAAVAGRPDFAGATLAGIVQGATPLRSFGFDRAGQQRRAPRQLPVLAQLEFGILKLLHNAGQRDLQPLIDHVKELALQADMVRLATLVKAAGHRLRITDLSVTDVWPGTDKSVRAYISQKQHEATVRQARR